MGGYWKKDGENGNLLILGQDPVFVMEKDEKGDAGRGDGLAFPRKL